MWIGLLCYEEDETPPGYDGPWGILFVWAADEPMTIGAPLSMLPMNVDLLREIARADEGCEPAPACIECGERFPLPSDETLATWIAEAKSQHTDDASDPLLTTDIAEAG